MKDELRQLDITEAQKSYFLSNKLIPIFANGIFIVGSLILILLQWLVGYAYISLEVVVALIGLAVAYFVCAIPYYLSRSGENIETSKGQLALNAIRRFIAKDKKIEHEEKTALLFIVVKFYFLPLMLFFLMNYLQELPGATRTMLEIVPTISLITGFNHYIFPFLVMLIFLIDVLYFSFGYLVESRKLNNEVRSVEPTFFGWFVALACYPPFNGGTGSVIGWYASDLSMSGDSEVRFVLSFLGVLLLLVYVASSVSLGAKCSNLTNRGIVSRGTYAFVRHPAYASKTLAWWLSVIPTFNLYAYGSMLLWTLIYYARAITEERHLLLDPDYKNYMEKVKYKFIPGIY